jgi:hypothetical protein
MRPPDRRDRASRRVAALLCSVMLCAGSAAFAADRTPPRPADPMTWPVPTPAEAAAREAAGEAFTRDLVAKLRARPEPRFQLAAAVLLVDGTRDGRAEGEALFARIRAGNNDPLVLHFAANGCRFDAATCDADGALDALLARDPRDAEAIFLALDRAKRRGDAAAFDPLLQALSGAEFSHGHIWSWYRWWTEVFGLMGDDPRVPMLGGSAAVDARPLPAEIAIGSAAFGRAMAVPFVGRGTLRDGCTAALAEPAFAARLPPCRKVAAWLRDRGPSGSDQFAGFRLGWVVAVDDAERARLEQDWRRREWRARMTAHEGVPAQHPDGLAGWRRDVARLFALLLTHDTEAAARAAFLAELGLPLEPPADYRSMQRLAELIPASAPR